MLFRSSKDNLARYTDGHGYCFGCKYYESPTKALDVSDLPRRTDLIPIEYSALKKRGITEETCKFFKYGIGQFNNQTVQVAQYVRDGEVVAQKLRFPSKDFISLGDTKSLPLFGMHLWRDGGRMVTVVEGEVDALTVSQLFGNKWQIGRAHV